MSSAPRVAILAKERFREAILNSLAAILKSGEKITIESVVSRARYSDGRSVGKSTMFAKDGSGEYVHLDLRKAISTAADNQSKTSKVRILRQQKISAVEKENKELKVRIKLLTDQLVEQEFNLERSESKKEADRHRLLYLEEQVFVGVSVANELAHGTIADFKRFTTNFSDKYQDDPALMSRVSSSVSTYISIVRKSKIIKLPDEPMGVV